MSLRSLIAAAGFDTALQDTCVAYFQPGAQRLNLAEMEAAQDGYRELRKAQLTRFLPIVERGLRGLIRTFGPAVMSEPTLAQQRQQPN